MSTGAELSLVGAPVVGLGVIAGGVLALTAGVVVIGGVALVGTANLCIAAGSYAAERMDERARLCAAEYERYEQLRAQVYALTDRKRERVRPRAHQQPAHATLITLRTAPAYTIAPSVISQLHNDAAVAAKVAESIQHELANRTSEADEQLMAAQRRAYLEAMLTVESQRLSLDIVQSVRGALSSGNAANMAAAVTTLQLALARAVMSEIDQLTSALADLEAQASAIATTTPEPELRRELRDLQRATAAARLMNDRILLEDAYARYERELERIQERAVRRASEIRSAELAAIWGSVQAVGGLFADLRVLEEAGQIAIRQELIHTLDQVLTRHRELEKAPVVDLPTLRQEAEILRVQLRGLQAEGTAILNRYYQQRLAGELDAALVDLASGDMALFSEVTQEQEADGTIALRGIRGGETLLLRVRPDGRLKYEAFGYGDERCLGVVYALLDRLQDRGVMLGDVDLELTKQAKVVTQVLAALRQLKGFADQDIRVYEDASVVTIEAGHGFITQIEVNRDGEIEVPQADRVTNTESLNAQIQQPEVIEAAKDRSDKQQPKRQRQRS